ncbi:hypothetical protein TcBrA4_0106100 [Trypanosoma cruzi]|nr:hypothetical protein TcBrA4_0106100 [Trypanosoma cruzi]
MLEFDLLDDAEEILQPLCLCLNQDSSRVGVGHHKGYVIYRIHRRPAPAGTEEASSSSAAASSTGPPFYTTIEAVFPPRRGTQCSTPSTWDVHEGAPSPHAAASSTAGTSRARRMSGDHRDEVDHDTLLDALAHSPLLQRMGKPLESKEKEESQVTLEGTSVNSNPVGTSATTLASALLGQNFLRWTEEKRDAPLPTETGVGAMALLYKTQFVAVVGGGPYPVGPKNVVKIFLTGDMWADREICVPDPVEELRLDHRLVIILTTREMRLHSFETELCIFSVPLWADTVPTSRPSTSTSPLFSASVSLNSTRLQQLNLGASVTAASTLASAASATRFVAPLAIDYSKKCIAFRNAMVGFSLVRYDAEASLCNRVNAELLSTVSVAHEHALSSLAMDLNGDIRSSGSNTAYGSMRWHIATCSERGTIIRVWRYYERRGESPSTVDTTASSAPHSSDVAVKSTIAEEDSSRTLPGYFVRVREVRNASLPTPIFQMRFLGEAFLFCIAWNKLKIFFVGEQEQPKPYDISTKDPSKTVITQNSYSSLHHLSVVSAYFNSEWAACECPLPLTDDLFLPKWVNTTSGELRQHLLRGMGSSSRMTVSGNGVEGETSRVSADPEIPAPVSLLNDIQVSQSRSQSSLVGTVPARSKSQDFGGILRRYVLQMAPMVESAGRVARNYWGFGGESTEAARSGVNEVTNDYSQKRDYTTMTELAQSVVVWWEQPTYWQVEYMTKSLSRLSTTTTTTNITTTGEVFLNRNKCPRPTVLYCVTCDGSAISFEFDPVKGTIECSKATAVSSLED